MSDFLDRLIANEHGTTPTLMPRVQARFEADRSQPEPLENLTEAFSTSHPASPLTSANPNPIAALGRESTIERIETTHSHEQRLERIVEMAHRIERQTSDKPPQASAPRERLHTDEPLSSRTRTADSPQRPVIQPERLVISREPHHANTGQPGSERRRQEANTTIAKSPTAPERLFAPQPTGRSEASQAPAPETSSESIVHVSIGRLDVRAAAPNEPARRRATPPPSGRLDRYLEERNRGRAK